MRRHPLAAEEDLDGLLGDAGLNLLMHEVVRDAVVMLGNLDMIMFEELDHSALTPLPDEPYEYAEWKRCVCRATPPKKENARTCEAIQSGRLWLRLASA
jgi:hypothetical protein